MDLREYRKEIDRIDEELVKLLEERLRIAEKIAECKKAEGISIVDSAREEEKLQGISSISEEEFKEYNQAVFRTIITVSKEYQGKKIGDSLEEEK